MAVERARKQVIRVPTTTTTMVIVVATSCNAKAELPEGFGPRTLQSCESGTLVSLLANEFSWVQPSSYHLDG